MSNKRDTRLSNDMHKKSELVEPIERQQKGESVECPFCKGKDFDLIGLKSHLEKWCDIYKQTNGLSNRNPSG